MKSIKEEGRGLVVINYTISCLQEPECIGYRPNALRAPLTQSFTEQCQTVVIFLVISVVTRFGFRLRISIFYAPSSYLSASVILFINCFVEP